MDVHSGEILGDRLLPDLRPGRLHPAADPERRSNALYRDPSRRRSPTARSPASIRPARPSSSITAIAALESGDVTPDEVIYDPGSARRRRPDLHRTPAKRANGSVSLVSALEVSSDVFFYTLGLRMWDTGELQHWAHALGIGRPTGIDLPGAAEGLLPTQHWRNQLYKEGETERPWSAGDNVQLATGQGDLQTNPLQMAIAYAALANGGTVVTPHVGLEIDDAAGRVLQRIRPRAAPPRPHRPRPTATAILEGLHDAAQSGGRHLVRRLRRLPDPGRRQDRHRAAPALRGPVLVRGAGALPEPARSSPS